ncbi:MAG: phosphate acyltransferase PlsX [Defluviitaleaceae bacterium]|nr:phosphate acyltransferase PlsX [Defluviitaleaceae bacterium]
MGTANNLTIAIDAMGCDLGPSVVVDGALQASRVYPGVKLILVGQEDIIQAELAKHTGFDNISVLHASEVITPEEGPTSAIRQKKDSSLVVGLKAVKEGQASGFVSAGSTGALLTGATVIIGRKKGIERPALGAPIPTRTGFTLLADSGANMDCKASYLVQFGQIGAEYMEKALGIKNPKVGLINVGTEEEKGNAAVKEAYVLLAESGLNFVGNVEAREIPAGTVDVAVCDGFVGNVVLKFMEGLAQTMMGMIKEELMSSTMSKIGALMAKGAFGNIKKRFDYREVGGAPFLGLKSLVVKAHGSSDAFAMKNAIIKCIDFEKENKHGV